MRIAFIGLGNLGGKLAGSLRRNDWQVCIYNLSAEAMAPQVAAGATTAATPAEIVDDEPEALAPRCGRWAMVTGDGDW